MTTDERLKINHDSIVSELGAIAAKGMPIRAIKIYRSIYGISLIEAKNAILLASDKHKEIYT